MVDRLAHPAGVVRLDRARAELRRDVAIEKDDRNLELGELLERRGIGLARRATGSGHPPACSSRNRICATSSAGWPSEPMNISE